MPTVSPRAPVRSGDRSSWGRGSSPSCGSVTRVPQMPDDRTSLTLRTPQSPISWAFTSELQSVQKSVGQHACNLKQLESKVCGLQRRLTESNNRIDALEAESCAMAEKPNTPRKPMAEWSHDMIVARQDTLSASITEMEERFDIFRMVMANIVAASASKVDSKIDKLGCVPNVSTDDLQVSLANASDHIKRLEKLNDMWMVHRDKDSITGKGSLHLDEPLACAGAGHVHNLRVAALPAAIAPACVSTGAATVPAPLRSAPLHPLERVRLDDRRLAGTKGSKSSFTREESSESIATPLTLGPSIVAKMQAVQHTSGCLSIGVPVWIPGARRNKRTKVPQGPHRL